MINKLKVDGFRSLIDFRTTINRGLNIIVGPNGTGKSNFISFLDFLSTFLEDDLNSAIATSHGAASVFSKERSGPTESKLSFSIDGSWSGISESLPEWRKLTLFKEASYEYTCEMRYIFRIPAVFVAHEKLTISSASEGNQVFTRRTLNDGNDFRHALSFDISDSLRQDINRYIPPSSSPMSIEDHLTSRLAPEYSLLASIHYMIDNISHILSDLSQYRSVNIDPSVARKPTPVGSNYQLMPSGEGLAGSLYQLKRGAGYFPKNRLSGLFAFENRRVDVSFDQIVNWCQEVNADICNIDVRLNFADAQLNPFLIFKSGSGTIDFPFSRISDGTVKWLAIVTMLLSDQDLNLIEEPENFLHPFMQEIFVALCRKVLEDSNDRSLIISTHSPSLLDCCSPTELKLFELDNGQTRAVDVENWQELQKKISSSRFGLGYYYRIGALYGTYSGVR